MPKKGRQCSSKNMTAQQKQRIAKLFYELREANDNIAQLLTDTTESDTTMNIILDMINELYTNNTIEVLYDRVNDLDTKFTNNYNKLRDELNILLKDLKKEELEYFPIIELPNASSGELEPEPESYDPLEGRSKKNKSKRKSKRKSKKRQI